MLTNRSIYAFGYIFVFLMEPLMTHPRPRFHNMCCNEHPMPTCGARKISSVISGKRRLVGVHNCWESVGIHNSFGIHVLHQRVAARAPCGIFDYWMQWKRSLLRRYRERGREYLFLLIPPIDEMTSQGRSSLMTKYDFYSVIDCRMSRLNDSHAHGTCSSTQHQLDGV